MSTGNNNLYAIPIPSSTVQQEAPKKSGSGLKRILTIASGVILGMLVAVGLLVLFAFLMRSRGGGGSSLPSKGDSRLKVTSEGRSVNKTKLGLRNRNSSPLVIDKMEILVFYDDLQMGSLVKENYVIPGSWAHTVEIPTPPSQSVKKRWPDVKMRTVCVFKFKEYDPMTVTFKSS